MDFGTATQIAISVPSGTPPYFAAETICRIRGIDPWGGSLINMPNWQAVIVEQMCSRAIVEELWPNRS